jgi:hypothetical protein
MPCTHEPSYATEAEFDIAPEFFSGQAREIHGQNVSAGWWTNPATGESIRETRNRGEIMMLIVSELAEAAEGVAEGLKDDKLPHLPMFDVELADTAIRLLDLLGVESHLNPEEGFTEAGYDMSRREMAVLDRPQEQLMLVVRKVAAAMEFHRKGRLQAYVGALWRVQEYVFGLAAVHDIDLMRVIAEKRAFNAVRADHKLENRIKEGGKAY